MVKCQICGGEFAPWQVQRHHTSYFPFERTMVVCVACHNEIHKGRVNRGFWDQFLPKHTRRVAKQKSDLVEGAIYGGCCCCCILLIVLYLIFGYPQDQMYQMLVWLFWILLSLGYM
ncbi:MAG: hypothetical protein ACETVN_00895 [Asgard group archaeon]